MLSVVKNLLFPKMCCGCQKLGAWICADCYHTIEFLDTQPVLHVPEVFLDGVWAVAEYQTPISELVHQLKYQSVKDLASQAATLLYFSQPFKQVDVVCPVPMPSQRLRQRGYNQAALIAKHLAKLIKKPFLEPVRRVRYRQSQLTMQDRSKRWLNQRDAFEVDCVLPSKLSILLVDDVLTTGSTLNAVAAAIKHANSRVTVYGLTLAHQ